MTQQERAASPQSRVGEVRCRVERDSLGSVNVPADKLWGSQTQRSLENFRISDGERMPLDLVHCLMMVKLAAARVNSKNGKISPEIAQAIIQGAEEVLSGKHDTEFPLVVW